MLPWVSDLVFFLLLSAAISAIVIAGWFVVVLIRQPERLRPYMGEKTGLRSVLGILGVPWLLVAVTVSVLVLSLLPRIGVEFRMIRILSDVHRATGTPSDYLALVSNLLFVMPLLLGLLAIRWIRCRPAAIWVATVALFGGVWALFVIHQHLFLESLGMGSEEGTSLFTPSYYIPVGSGNALMMAVPVLGILLALVGYSLLSRWYIFIAFGTISCTVCYGILQPLAVTVPLSTPVPAPWKMYLSVFLASAVLFATLWGLPKQRRALLGVAGIVDAEESSRIARTMTNLGRGAFLCCTSLLVLSLYLMRQVENRAADIILHGPAPLVYSPALVNAWGVMTPRFERSSHDWKSLSFFGYLGRRDGNLVQLHTETDLNALGNEVTPEIREGLHQEESIALPLVSDLVAAGHADYVSPYKDGAMQTPSYLALRETNRWLALRARIACVDLDWPAALADVSCLYRYTALPVDGNLVTQMVHTAIRGIGNATTNVYWQAFRNDREAMQALADLMDTTAVGNRRSFPTESLRRHEPGFQAVVPFADITVPAMVRAVTIYQRNATHFDELRIAVALELYRHDHDGYPEKLDALVPDYLPRIPLDAFDGKPYVYTVEPDRIVLEIERNLEPDLNDGSRDLTKSLDFIFPANDGAP